MRTRPQLATPYFRHQAKCAVFAGRREGLTFRWDPLTKSALSVGLGAMQRVFPKKLVAVRHTTTLVPRLLCICEKSLQVHCTANSCVVRTPRCTRLRCIGIAPAELTQR